MNSVKAKDVKGFWEGEGVCGRWRGVRSL